MPYEVVDPAERDERGVIYPDLTAAMVAASPTLEVWELADDAAQTRCVRCWPDPEHEPAASLAEKRAEREAHELSGYGDREAAALIARVDPTSRETWAGTVSLAWKYGYIAGFGACAERTQAAFDRLEQVVKE